MIRPARTPPAKEKTLTQQKSDFTAEGAPAPALPSEATKAVAPVKSVKPVKPVKRKPTGFTLRP